MGENTEIEVHFYGYRKNTRISSNRIVFVQTFIRAEELAVDDVSTKVNEEKLSTHENDEI